MKKHNFDEIVNRRNTECKKWDTHPTDVIPMWIADTDFKCPHEIIAAMQKRVEHGIFGYPVNANNFNEAIVNWQKKRFGWEISADMVEYTPAVVPAIIFALRAFSCPGDRVVVQMPAYHPFHAIIPDNGRYIAANQLIQDENGEYQIDWLDLENKLSHPRTKIFLLCHPHNPVGKVFSLAELEKIAILCAKYSVLVVSDEIHSDIVYAGNKHIPFGKVSSLAAENCIVCVNPSKTFNIAGMRSGAVVIPNKLIHRRFYAAVEDNKAYGRTIFGTLPIEVAYNECDYYADQLLDYLTDNLNYLRKYLQDNIPQIKVYNHQATYLVWLDCKALAMPPKQLNDFFLKEAKVAMNEGSTFGSGGEGFMRMNIACPRTTLEAALERIAAAVDKLNL